MFMGGLRYWLHAIRALRVDAPAVITHNGVADEGARAVGRDFEQLVNEYLTNIVFPVAVPFITAIPRPPFDDEMLPAATPPPSTMMPSPAFCTALEPRTLRPMIPKEPFIVATLSLTFP
jgi:hypothetical protein